MYVQFDSDNHILSFMVYRLINHADCWKNKRSIRKSRAAGEFSSNIPSGLPCL